MHEKGMVLLSTLCMIVMISLLILTNLQQNALYAKALGRIQHRDRNFYALEKLAHRLLGVKAEKCITKKEEMQNILNQLPVKGCNIFYEDIAYKYLIEDFGIFPCLRVKVGDKYLASKHVRLSVMVMKEKGEYEYLQLWNIVPIHTLHDCESKETQIQSGIQSWAHDRFMARQ